MKKTHGGKRKRSGRKKIDDKKITVNLFFRESKIKEVGLENLKQKCYELFDIYE